MSPGGDPEPLRDGDEILLTQPAVVLEQLIGKFLFHRRFRARRRCFHSRARALTFPLRVFP